MTDESFKVQVLQVTASLITAAFALVAALAWNEAIKDAIAEVFSSGDALMGEFIYAIIVTVLAVAASVLIARALSKAKASLKENDKD
ncbi:MAG: DUF5654 family protein [Candidatus Methanoplasma sp.]|jgi:ABC-type glycerol-3-phosphate transport system permease component|nr:DUF5654 family protein [Candidatus Methanoplasma sp.]